MSRGIWWYMSARTRRSVTFFWTALFVLSLLMQYATFAAAPPVAAVHDEGVFELDGNAVDQAAPGDDWQNGTAGAFDSIFLTDPINGVAAERLFTGGDSKDIHDISSWLWTSGPGVQDKNDISNAYAAGYFEDDELLVYFGLDRYAANGDAQAGFWFVQDEVGMNANGTFFGSHQVGDTLVQIDFENGGTDPVVRVYEWVGSGGDTSGTLDLVAEGGLCTLILINDTECAIPNTSTQTAPWAYDDKFDPGTGDAFPAGAFLEGGINLTALGLDDGCFTSFIAETRSSQSPTATLSDFALGSFSLCEEPDLQTQVQQAGQNVSSINVGESVVDVATLTGSKGTVEGTIDFFACGPTAHPAKPDCTTGGTKVGATKTLSGGSATSDAFTPTAEGWFCFRAEYTPAAGSKYLATEHTNQTTECFRVIPAEVQIVKTPDSGTVSAGSSISFTLSWGNIGEGSATGVVVTDDLPDPAGVEWSIEGTTGSGSTCALGGTSADQTLTCNVGTMAGNTPTHGSVTLTSVTTADSCGLVNNTGAITSTNDGSDSDPGQITVQCPDVKVTKTPDGGSVNAGEDITWSIKVENLGPGTATGVALTDSLPSGVDWSESEADCTITGSVGSEVLTCTVGTLTSGASKTYSATGTTDKDDCGPINNTGTASATNEPSNVLGNNTDSGSVEVLCAEIDVEKVADASTVNAGEQIGFTVTISNNGSGTASGLSFTDHLPGGDGISWSISPASTGWSITGSAPNQQLVYAPTTLAGNSSTSVHVVSNTTADSCGEYDNTASVTTTNDGEDSDSDSVTVQCPSLEVFKSGNGPLSAGEIATFTITVWNYGPGVAKDVSLTDQLPPGSWTLGGTNAADCEIDGSNLLACDFGDLSSNTSRSFTVSKTTDPDDCGTIQNEVTIAATNEPSDDEFSNTDDADIVVNCPDLEVVKTGNGTISAGEVASFDITVTNLGPGTAFDVTLSDQLPSGTWTLGGANAADCDIDGSNLLSCDFGNLADDAWRTITLSRETVADDCGEIPNTVTVAASNEAADDLENNEDSDTVTVLCADITITKTADAASVNAGDPIGFTITVTNTGDGTAFGVSVTDTLPTDAGLDWSIDGGAAAADCEIAGGILSCDFGTMATGTSKSVHISSPTTPATCGTVDNTASVTTTNDGSDSDDSSVAVLCAEIDIEKVADADEVVAGEQLGFTITVTNRGEGTAYGVEVVDELPGTLDWSIAGDANGFSIVAGNLVFGPADLAAGASVSVHIVADTTREDCGVVDNTASVTTTNDGSDEDSDSVSVRCPELTIDKSFTGNTGGEGPGGIAEAKVGDVLTYTLAYDLTNGPVHNGVITDVLPAGLEFIAGSAAGNAEFTFTSYDATTRTLRWDAALVSSDGSVSYQVRVLTGADELPQPLVNVATIDSDETDEDQDEAEVFVEPPPLVVTSPPKITLPPTNTLEGPERGTSNPGQTLMLVLLGLAGFALAVGFVTPVPARARRPSRR